MSVTIKQIEDAILAALAADATISGWGGSIVTADEASLGSSDKLLVYPAIVVAYYGTTEASFLSGGSGVGAQFSRPGMWNIFVLERNLRGRTSGRGGDPADSKHPGAYKMIEEVIRVIGYKDFGLSIKRMQYIGDAFFEDEDSTVVGYSVTFQTQWETTCAAD